jgi:hypothetical protein
MRAAAATIVLASLLLARPATAQGNIALSAAQTVQVVQSRAQNAALMKQYVWDERIDFLVNGQQKDLRIDLVNFGPDGKIQRTVLNDQSAPLPRGFFRRSIAEGEKKDVEEYIQGLGKLLHAYTLPTPGAVMNFLDAAVPVPQPDGSLMISGQNVVQPGDSLSVWVNAATRKTLRMTVSTSFQGNPVSLSATFLTLPTTGLNYCGFAELTVPAKGYAIQVQNFNFNRTY